MIKIIKNLIVATFIVSSIVFMILETNDVINAVNHSIKLWATRVFPVLFPFYIITSLALFYGVAHFIGEILKPMTTRLFKTSSISGFVFFMSLLAGNPTSAIIISQLYENHSITKDEAEHLLKFSVFANPLFCIGTIGIAYFNNITIGYIVLIAHIMANLLIGISLRFSIKHREDSRFSLKEAYIKMEHARSKHKLTFGETLTKILTEGINKMFLIGSFMIFFNIIIVIIKSSQVITYSYQYLTFILNPFNVSFKLFNAFFIGIFEMVLGVDHVIQNQFNLHLTVVLITMIISFGGLSIHAQIQSIVLKLKVKYFPFFIARITQMIFSGFIAYYLFPFFYKEKTTTTFYINQIKVSEKNLILTSIILLITTLVLMTYTRHYSNKKKLEF